MVAPRDDDRINGAYEGSECEEQEDRTEGRKSLLKEEKIEKADGKTKYSDQHSSMTQAIAKKSRRDEGKSCAEDKAKMPSAKAEPAMAAAQGENIRKEKCKGHDDRLIGNLGSIKEQKGFS